MANIKKDTRAGANGAVRKRDVKFDEKEIKEQKRTRKQDSILNLSSKGNSELENVNSPESSGKKKSRGLGKKTIAR